MGERLGVYLLFFLSGICGLIYQVVWVRQFSNVFGSTVYSAALVTAVFMGGLGVGGFVAGRWGDRLYTRARGALLRAYGYLEVAIGLLGLVAAVGLPLLEPLSGYFSSYVVDEQGWYALSLGSRLARYGVAIAVLLPATTLMGGTLTLLIRHLVRHDTTVAGLRVGALYGINTAGAALGAFLVDFLFVPGVGLLATQSIAVVLNLAVGLVAIRWATQADAADRAARGSAQRGPAGVDGVPAGRAPFGRRPAWMLALTGLAILLSGFAAMGLEMLWFRYLSTVLGTRRATFSLLLTVILVGIWLGSVAGGAAQRKWVQHLPDQGPSGV